MKSKLTANYRQILSGLKEKIRLAQQRAIISVNVQLLQMYWEIGQTIAEQEKKDGWGTKVVETLSNDLLSEFPDMKGLSVRNLRYMRDFAVAYPQFSILQALPAKLKTETAKSKTPGKNKPLLPILQAVPAKLELQQKVVILIAQLPWTHNTVMLAKLKDIKERIFYAERALQHGWSSRILAAQIEGQLHLRSAKAISNFDKTLPPQQSDLAKESFKNPYLFDFLGLSEEMQERDLENALIVHIKKFMLELGKGFAYVGNQHQLIIDGDEYFLDLLFFNYHLNCFVIFELKVGDFMPEYAGKLNFYINTVEDKMRLAHHQPTIGILLCKTPNKTVVEYALRNLASPLGVADYALQSALPKKLSNYLPVREELENYLTPDTVKHSKYYLEKAKPAVKKKTPAKKRKKKK